MNIDFSQLKMTFSQKPLLIGGKAMEYYDLRKAGDDSDFIVTKSDFESLVQLYPKNLKDLWGDLGVAVHGFEIWKTIDYFDYAFLSQNAIEESNYRVISLEKLLLQRAMAMNKPKYHLDLELVVKRITDDQYSNFDKMQAENESLMSELSEVQYIEKVGPEDSITS